MLLVLAAGHDLATLARVFAPSYASAESLAAAMPEEARDGAAAVFSRLDSDGDGRVTREELGAAFPQTLAAEESVLKQVCGCFSFSFSSFLCFSY